MYSSSGNFVFKHKVEDFRVQESMIVEDCPRADAKVQYARLRKSGFTTHEAIEFIASRNGICSSLITYGGRKDEDGITEQIIAVPIQIDLFPENCQAEWVTERGSIQLSPFGYGKHSIKIGGVGGNAFRTVIRNLDEEQALNLWSLGRSTVFCLNYYDTQRFGLPNLPKRTHLVGKAILERRWDLAGDELVRSGSPEATQLAEWEGTSEEFFASLDRRKIDFYLASHISFGWNAALSALVREHCESASVSEQSIEELEYALVDKSHEVLKLMQAMRELPYRRFESRDGETTERLLMRPTVVQVVAAFDEMESDLYFPGKYCVPISFLLPSGCYATMVLRQINLQLL